MTLGEKIKKYRELRELTQRELGQKVGFSSGTEDSRIEYGCPVSEAQEEYDIWKAQFPKNLERTEIRHN